VSRSNPETEGPPLIRSSHTHASMLRLFPELGLVDLADPRLGERLAETGALHLETFSDEMHRAVGESGSRVADLACRDGE
jgi:hypothetical protein